VCLEDLGEETVVQPPDTFPAALTDAILPPATPSGRPIRRRWISRSLTEVIAQIALGTIVHPTMASITVFARDDIVLVPINDLPPMPLGPIWLAPNERPVIRALAACQLSLTDEEAPGLAEPYVAHRVLGPS
jgi:hypothetical protein